jgi:hypothetical protein
MQKVILMFLLFLLCGCGWSTQTILLESAWQGIHAVDYLQTIQIANHPEKYRETNLILGPHPSTQSVAIYSAVTAIGHAAITGVLEEYQKDWVPYWQGITIVIDGAAVINNYQIGIRF